MVKGKWKMGCGLGIIHMLGLITAILLFWSSHLQAQEVNNQPDIRSLTKIRLTIFGVGLEREQKIGHLKSIYAGLSMSSVFLFEPEYTKGGRAPDVLNIEGSLGVTPVVYTGFRKYYNMGEREKRGKKTINNSGSFIGMHISATFPIKQGGYKSLFALAFAPHAGFQRSLGTKTNFEFSVGPALKTNFEATRLVPFSKIGLTFLL